MVADRPHLSLPATSCIAQQYSFATFVSLIFHSRKENSEGHSKILFQFFTFFIRNYEITQLGDLNWGKVCRLNILVKLSRYF
jgi:hypothetical protein